MRLRLAFKIAPVIAACVAGGCANQPTNSTGGPYRTIRVEPQRDTEAAKRLNQVGLDHMAKGDLDKAVESFGRALEADVEFGPAHNNLGKAYFKKREWYQAAWEFEYARKLLPRHAEPANNLGLVMEEVGEFDKAVNSYREAVALDPLIDYRANLVRAMIRRGDRTEEVRDLLQQVAAEDTRPTWQAWARQQLELVRSPVRP